jgi:hypothetical protein
VHKSSRIRRVREGVPPFGVLYATLPCFHTRACFQDLNPWPFSHIETILPLCQGAPLKVSTKNIIRKNNKGCKSRIEARIVEHNGGDTLSSPINNLENNFQMYCPISLWSNESSKYPHIETVCSMFKLLIDCHKLPQILLAKINTNFTDCPKHQAHSWWTSWD